MNAERVNDPAGGAVQNTKHNGVISVQALGEVVCPPDTVQFSVSISSAKESFEGAQASVQRRSDYVVQVLRNSGIKDREVTCSSDVVREESMVTVTTEVLVQSDGLVKCESLRNLLIEKLDPSVNFTSLTYHHSPASKDKARYIIIVQVPYTYITHAFDCRLEAFKRAAENAKAKAESIAQTVGVRLGAAMEVLELGQDVSEEDQQGADAKSSSHYRKFRTATLHFSSKVSIVFESLPYRCCSHKKCRKH